MWNYIDLNLKDEIPEIQEEILFFKLFRVNNKNTGNFGVLEQLSWRNHEILIQLLYIKGKIWQNIV